MSTETTSFILRFIKDASDAQQERWRGLIQHVQSGSRRNFANFTDAVGFMTNLVQPQGSNDSEEGMDKKNPWEKMMGDMTDFWTKSNSDMMNMFQKNLKAWPDETEKAQQQMQQAIATTMKQMGMPNRADQDAMNDAVSRMETLVNSVLERMDQIETKLDNLANNAPKATSTTRKRTRKTTTNKNTTS